MFNNLFNRTKATPATPAATPLSAPEKKAPVIVAPALNRLEAFKEDWEDRREASQEVIEGNGGNTDWGAWTEAVENEEKGFAQTVPMPLNPFDKPEKPD